VTDDNRVTVFQRALDYSNEWPGLALFSSVSAGIGEVKQRSLLL
jgi:hypothetical protein